MHLAEAVAQGDVIEGQNAGRRLYYFPPARNRQEDAHGTSEVSRRSKAIELGAHSVIGELVDTAGWKLATSGPSASTSGPSLPNLIPMIGEEDVDLLSSAGSDLGKAIQEAERLVARLQPDDPPQPGPTKSKWATMLMTTLQECLPNGTTLRDEIMYWSKFRRARGGGALTTAACADKASEAAGLVAELRDLCQSLKGLGGAGAGGRGR